MEAKLIIEIDGESDTLSNWAKKFQVPRISAYRRHKRGKTGKDIFNVQVQDKRNPNTVRQYSGTPNEFEEMAQLNIAMPKWQVEAIERIARVNGVKRTKMAHRILAKYLQDSAEAKARVEEM
jgi:hypothetical protein